MKTRIYLRIARTRKGAKVVASMKPNYEAIESGMNYSKVVYPTVLIALDLSIPDREFDAAKILLDAEIKKSEPCVTIKQVSEKVKP